MVKRLAVIDGFGLVTNVIVWPDAAVIYDGQDYAAGEIPASTVDVGDRTASPDDTFDGRIFTAPAPADPRTPDEIAIDAILDKTDADITDPEVKQLTILQARQMRGVRS